MNMNTNNDDKNDAKINNIGINLMDWGYMHVAKPIVFHMKPDDAHENMVKFCKIAEKIPGLMGLLSFMTKCESNSLHRNIMGIDFNNPFGLSGGLDKTGELLTCMDAAGWGFETIGTMTGTYSKGNDRPWYHRLPEQTALLVHAGLPSEGAETVVARAEHKKRKHGMVLFGSVGPSNKKYDNGVEGMIEDYMKAFNEVNYSYAFKAIEVNISCPNLQFGEPFSNPNNVKALFQEFKKIDIGKPVMVKMPSVMKTNEIDSLLEILADFDYVKGVSVSNLRRDRTGLDIPSDWIGNISGLPAQECNENIIKFVRKHYDDRFVINGIGGTITPDDALRKLDEGADLVSGITTFMYRGPQMMAEWKRALINRK